MTYHKLLRRQIKQHLSAKVLAQEEVQAFLKSINDSYGSYDREHARVEHAFQIARSEVEQVNREIGSLVDQRKRSLQELSRAAAELADDSNGTEAEGDLVSLSESIRGQVHVTTIVKDELTRNINLFKALLNNLKSAVVIENEHNEILFANELLADFFSEAFHPQDIIGDDAVQTRDSCKFIFSDPDKFIADIQVCLQNRVPVYNQQLELKDGRILERDYVPIFVNGAYKGHLWKFNDVTAKARYEHQLRESEERNRLIMNSSMDAIVVSDQRGTIQYWNPRAEELYGWSFEEVKGKNGVELTLPERLWKAWIMDLNGHLSQQKKNGKNRVLELEAVNRAGEHFPIELALITYEQHGETFYAAFIKDISTRKRWENRLRAQEEKYRNIITDMNLGLVGVDLNETINYVNQSFCNMSGYSMDELVGQHASFLQFEEANMVLLREKMEISAKGMSGTFEITAKNKAGEKRWWFVSGGPSYNDDGEQIGSIGVHLDITEQKRMKEELEIAKNSAEQASEAKEAFLANMSHEIRTPLNAIIGMIRELSREKLSPKQQSYLSHTDSAARHLLSIVNSILDISKIEAGELELDCHDFSLEALVANLRSILHIKAAQKGLTLDCCLSPTLWKAHLGDSARLRQVLINLLGNAIKFTMQGTVSMYAEVVEEDQTGQTLRIEVADTGIGMAPEYLGEIFSKFSQAERSTSRRFGGTGLGMSITKEIVRLMDGTIEVTSEKGVGTRFVIQVRLAKGNIDKLTLQEEQNQHLLEGTHILLVEDNIMNRFIARKSLSHFGCTVDEAENGRIAIDLLKEKAYDLILMDIQMPELDGVATTKIIRGDLRLDVPIIAVTANAFKKDIDLYLSIGMNDFVTKPFEEHALFETLSQQLRISRTTDKPTVAYTASSCYDLGLLRKLGRGDETFVQKMVGIFVEQMPVSLQEICQALAQKDYPSVAQVAHRIKPSIDSMGIGQLEGVAKDIEVYAKSDKVVHGVLASKVNFFCGTLITVVDKIREDELLLL
ncbi:PAS domain S-box-containing protein [Neolewinella xylanilytica]|uniref:histidine kinase n=1 Tax=Neolewinella xylanilytica TaxID=1514080 RepID=A0A2S6I891_9BACT|nr:PAS domain S-box protein [Neolewinella xylanilytica]PPK87717.1 PAS domain S-box-containing protein [Neolewinella xylanilytica]